MYNDGGQGQQPPASRGRKTWVLVLIVLVVAAVAVGIYFRLQQDKALAAKPTGRNALGGGPVPVSVATVAQKAMPVYLTGLGSVTPYYSVTIKTRVDGQLMRVNFREGQEVKQGYLLAEIDPKPYQAALDQAKGQLAKDQAQLADDQAEYNRYLALYNTGVSSKETLESERASFGELEGTVKADQAAIEAAQVNLNYCEIRSPITGRVGLRLVDPGNIVHAADATGLLLVTQLKPIAVIFTLPEDQLPTVIDKMHGGTPLTVEAYDRSDTTKIASGKLLTLDNQIDPTTGTDKLKAVFPNEDESLFPDQFVNIRLITEELPDAVVMPTVALQHGSQGDFVFVAKSDNTVEIRPVVVDLTEGTQMIMTSGVQPGEMVVVDGQEKLTTSSRIVIRPVTDGGQGTGGKKKSLGSGEGTPGTPGSGAGIPAQSTSNQGQP
jgi:multidrug efflux system membrane fusion protein